LELKDILILVDKHLRRANYYTSEQTGTSELNKKMETQNAYLKTVRFWIMFWSVVGCVGGGIGIVALLISILGK